MAETTTKDRVGHPECPRGEDHDRHTLTVGNGLQLTCEGRGPAKIKFTVTLTREMTKQVEWEVDSVEFAEWAEGKGPTPALIKEFMRAHRDAAEIEDSMWALAKDADDYISPFVEVVRVDLHG